MNQHAQLTRARGYAQGDAHLGACGGGALVGVISSRNFTTCAARATGLLDWIVWPASGIVVHVAPGISPASSAAAVSLVTLLRSPRRILVGQTIWRTMRRRSSRSSSFIAMNWLLSYLKVRRPSSPHRRLAATPSTRGALVGESAARWACTSSRSTKLCGVVTKAPTEPIR